MQLDESYKLKTYGKNYKVNTIKRALIPKPLYYKYIKFYRVLAAQVYSTYKLSLSQKNVI